MSDKNSLSFLDSDVHLSSREKLMNWMCIQHNVMKVEKIKPDFLNSDKEQAQYIYDALVEEDKIFVCTNENLKKRWGPLS